MEFIILSLHSSLGANGNKIPTPKSNPSNKTYKNIAVPIKIPQMSGKFKHLLEKLLSKEELMKFWKNY